MIFTKLYKRKTFSPAYIVNLQSNSNISSKQGTKYLTIYGKLYCQVNTTFIYISTHNRTYCQSLVEQGDNLVVSGEYFTVINTSLHRHVNFQGIDYHEINSVPIATISALADSQTVPVIIIIH